MPMQLLDSLTITYNDQPRTIELYHGDLVNMPPEHAVDVLNLHPELRVFYDRQSLNTGAAWQQALFDALDDCAHVLAVYSPAYLASKVCKEEFNIALFRHREEGDTLLPIYLYSANLPTYMQLIQFTDCREADRAKLREACAALAARL